MLIQSLSGISNIIHSISQWCIWKWLLSVLMGFLVALQPILNHLLIVVALIIADFIWGYKVSRLYRNFLIESRKLLKSVNKVIRAVVFLSSSYFLGNVVFGPDSIIKPHIYATALLGGSELWSLLESYVEDYKGAKFARILKKIIKLKGAKYFDLDLNDLEIDIEMQNDKKKKDEHTK